MFIVSIRAHNNLFYIKTDRVSNYIEIFCQCDIETGCLSAPYGIDSFLQKQNHSDLETRDKKCTQMELRVSGRSELKKRQYKMKIYRKKS